MLRLTAADGELSAFDEVTVAVYPIGGGPETFEVRVSASSDDAEERSSGGVNLTSSDLELIQASSGDQIVECVCWESTCPRAQPL